MAWRAVGEDLAVVILGALRVIEIISEVLVRSLFAGAWAVKELGH